MTKLTIVSLISVFTLSACVQSHVMAPHRALDSGMSCTEAAQRIAELNAIKRLTLKDKNSKNLVAGVLFFPAVQGNQNNVQKTISAINERQKVLTDIFQSNECVSEIPSYTLEQIRTMINKNQVRELQS